MNKSTAAHLPLTSHSVQTSNDTVLSLLWEKQGVSPFPSMYVFLEHHIEGRERSQWFCFYCQSFGHSTRYLRQLTVMENAPSLWFHNCEQMLTTRQATGNQGRALFASAGRDPFSPASSQVCQPSRPRGFSCFNWKFGNWWMGVKQECQPRLSVNASPVHTSSTANSRSRGLASSYPTARGRIGTHCHCHKLQTQPKQKKTRTSLIYWVEPIKK